MSYEDTIRVADLKTRASRFARVRAEVRVKPDQILRITEFMHPRVQEIADTLPAPIGRWLLRSGAPRRLVERLTARGRHVETTVDRRLPAAAKHRRAAPFPQTHTALCRRAGAGSRRGWGAFGALAARDPALALEVARCQRLVKGYGDTHARGWANFQRLMQEVDRLVGEPGRGGAACRAMRGGAGGREWPGAWPRRWRRHEPLPR